MHSFKFTISILIPSYNYPDGIRRIFQALSKDPKFQSSRVEIIICDDSTSNVVHDVANDYIRQNINFKIIKNSNPMGAVNNWNFLLALASGEYCILMHHDEFPCSNYFISNVLDLIDNNSNAVDVFSLNCITVDENGRCRKHSPLKLRKYYLKYCPSYILYRNIIGPTASVIFKRSKFIKFDKNLVWKVDVDFYYALLVNSRNWIWVNKPFVYSFTNRSDSITSNLKNEIDFLKTKEKMYLIKKYQLQNSRSIAMLIFLLIVECVWAGFRFYQLIFQKIKNTKLVYDNN